MTSAAPVAATITYKRPTRFTKRGPAWIPVYEPGRCADVDRHHAEQEREYQRQARRRWQAEELGDPQR